MGVMDWIKERNVKEYTDAGLALKAMDAWEAVIKDMKKMLAEEYDNGLFRSERADAFVNACRELGMTLWCPTGHDYDEPCPAGAKHTDIHINTIKCLLEAYTKVVVNDNKYKNYIDRHGKIQRSPAYRRVKKFVLPLLRHAVA